MRVLAVFLMVVALASGAWAQTGSLGIYLDDVIGQCSTDDTPGFFQVYVVYAGPLDTRGTLFRIAASSGFTPVYISELATVPQPGVDGDTRSGIFVSYHCQSPPVSIMMVTYQALGTSEPCSYLEVVAHPAPIAPPDTLGVYDCESTFMSVAGGRFYVNPTDACSCGVPVPVQPESWGRIKALYQ